jgi:hypothetical protein
MSVSAVCYQCPKTISFDGSMGYQCFRTLASPTEPVPGLGGLIYYCENCTSPTECLFCHTMEGRLVAFRCKQCETFPEFVCHDCAADIAKAEPMKGLLCVECRKLCSECGNTYDPEELETPDNLCTDCVVEAYGKMMST